MNGHIPVLKKEVIEAFKCTEGVFLDCTFGGGGHSKAILENNNKLSVIGIDIDPEAEPRAAMLKKQYPDRFDFMPMNFSDIERLNKTFDGVLMDLGVSSFQLDEGYRGFSFKSTGPLDMRMNCKQDVSARKFLKEATRDDLIKAVHDYGEEPQWKSVVNAILTYRDSEKLDTTTEFVDFLNKKTKLFLSKKLGIHPATRVFQGIRIAVNNELENLKSGLDGAFNSLNQHGNLAVISFHSLEDRIVKRKFNELCGKSTSRDDFQPKQFKAVKAELITKKPYIANEAEVDINPRSRSAKLRILKKL